VNRWRLISKSSGAAVGALLPPCNWLIHCCITQSQGGEDDGRCDR
jgi:hypothetical protein